jgi:hypothetical protein
LICVPTPAEAKNLWEVPNLLLQKFPAPQFTVTTKLTFTALAEGEETGLIVMGQDYARLTVKKTAKGLAVSQSICLGAERGRPEKEGAPVAVKTETVYLRVKVVELGLCKFSYSTDGVNYTPVGTEFTAKKGRWIGAKVGLFAVRATSAEGHEVGYADFDWFRVE